MPSNDQRNPIPIDPPTIKNSTGNPPDSLLRKPGRDPRSVELDIAAEPGRDRGGDKVRADDPEWMRSTITR
jgi:hypothetical protein